MWVLFVLNLSLRVFITSSNAVTIGVEAKYHAVTYDTKKVLYVKHKIFSKALQMQSLQLN